MIEAYARVDSVAPPGPVGDTDATMSRSSTPLKMYRRRLPSASITRNVSDERRMSCKSLRLSTRGSATSPVTWISAPGGATKPDDPEEPPDVDGPAGAIVAPGAIVG